MNIKTLIAQLNEIDEGSQLEAKLGSAVGDSILETICAFANEPQLGGGSILLGLKREDDSLFPQYIPIGVPDPDKLQRDIASQCASVFNNIVRVKFDTATIDGKVIVAVHVPEAPSSAKPIYFQRRGLPRGAFRRIGSSDVVCRDEDLAVLFADRSGDSFDTTLLADCGVDDIDPQAMGIYRSTRALVNPDAEELKLSDTELLISLGCAKRATSGIHLNVAGLHLFGKSLSIRRVTPTIRVDYVRVSGAKWVESSDARYSSSLDMRGPILSLIPRIQAAISDDLPSAFNLPQDSMQRTERKLLPTRVIREAVVNALMHRSYQVNSPILIIRYSNRLEIRNPGFSLKSEDRFSEPGSEPRNPRIAAVLHETNFAETKGTGIRTMISEMQAAALSPPRLGSDRKKGEFAATFLFHHLLGADDIAWLAKLRDFNLSDKEAKALIYLRESGEINNSTYRTLTAAHPLEATQTLRRLRDLGLIEAKGNTSDRYYVLTSKAAVEYDLNSEDIDNKDYTESGDNILSRNPNPISTTTPGIGGATRLAPKISDNAPDVPSKRRHLAIPAYHRNDLPVDLRLMLTTLRGRVPEQRFETAILLLCAWRSLKAIDIADLTGRNPDYIRKKLNALKKSGKLLAAFPDSPRHPDQSYKTAPK